MREYIKRHYPYLYKFLYRLKNPTAPIPFGLWFVNFIFQKILRINGNTPWMVHFTSKVTGSSKIRIGTDVWISFASSGGCYIQGINGIIIGDHTIFAPGVKIISSNHDPTHLDKHKKEKPIVIGKDCWIGANAVILPGVSLGDRCIVGAGAVVTKSFPSGSVIIGVPGKAIKHIDANALKIKTYE